MAKDRVIGFLHDLVGDPKLNRRIYSAERTPEAWVSTAIESGYDFTVSDLKDVAAEIAQESFEDPNFIPVLVRTLATDGKDGVSDEQFSFSGEGIARLKAVMQQGRYSGYYRPW